MPGRPPKVDHVRRDFIHKTNASRNLVRAIDQLPRMDARRNVDGIHPKHVVQITELAFMGVVSAWEEFLERTLVRYLAAAATDSGYHPNPKYGSANSIGHAYELLSQNIDYDPQKHYLKVSDPRWVTRTADFFFSRHSYTVLENNIALLRAAQMIRNRIAHDSEKCRSDFKTSALWLIRPPNDTLQHGYGPGALLVDTARRHFKRQIIRSNCSHFIAYMELYESLANAIVP